jgi:hypothetical protein
MFEVAGSYFAPATLAIADATSKDVLATLAKVASIPTHFEFRPCPTTVTTSFCSGAEEVGVPRRGPTLSGATPSRRHGLDGHHCCAGISAGVAALIGEGCAVFAGDARR